MTPTLEVLAGRWGPAPSSSAKGRCLQAHPPTFVLLRFTRTAHYLLRPSHGLGGDGRTLVPDGAAGWSKVTGRVREPSPGFLPPGGSPGGSTPALGGPGGAMGGVLCSPSCCPLGPCRADTGSPASPSRPPGHLPCRVLAPGWGPLQLPPTGRGGGPRLGVVGHLLSAPGDWECYWAGQSELTPPALGCACPRPPRTPPGFPLWGDVVVSCPPG